MSKTNNKTKKCDFKKLALLGIAGGVALSAEASANQTFDASQMLALNGCGGSNHCGGSSMGSKGGNSYQAYRNIPSQDANYYSQQSSGCQTYSAPQYFQQASSCAAYAPQGQYYSDSQNYVGYNNPQGQMANPTPGYGQMHNQMQNPNQMQNSNQMNPQMQMQNSDQMNNQMRNSNQMNNQMQNPNQMHNMQTPGTPTSANQGGIYTQWETGGYTADASKYNSQSSGSQSGAMQSDYNQSGSTTTIRPAATTTTTTQRTLTESELMSQLNDQSKAAYKGLDAAGKALALKMANQDCKNKNECKGMNSCKTSEHACAGKGSCAGTAPNNFKDKNLAVKVAALKMAEKRANATSSKNG